MIDQVDNNCVGFLTTFSEDLIITLHAAHLPRMEKVQEGCSDAIPAPAKRAQTVGREGDSGQGGAWLSAPPV